MNPIDRVQVINNVAVCIPSIGSLTTNPNVSDQSDHWPCTGMYPINQIIDHVLECIRSIRYKSLYWNVSDRSDSGHLQHTGMYPIDQIQVIDNEPEFFWSVRSLTMCWNVSNQIQVIDDVPICIWSIRSWSLAMYRSPPRWERFLHERSAVDFYWWWDFPHHAQCRWDLMDTTTSFQSVSAQSAAQKWQDSPHSSIRTAHEGPITASFQNIWHRHVFYNKRNSAAARTHRAGGGAPGYMLGV